MNKKQLILILGILSVCFVLAGPVFAKEAVKVKIDTDHSPFFNNGLIVITLVDSHGKPIKSDGTIHYNITDEFGNYKWKYGPYKSEVILKYPVGKYKVKVKFDGDSYYKKAKKTQYVAVEMFDPYTYYDNHNWGLNQKIDDYFDYTYWDEDIYDGPYTYDGEGP